MTNAQPSLLSLHTRGFTVVELLFALAVMTTMGSVAVAVSTDATDALRASMAARYLAARLSEARVQAVTRSACVGFRFEAAGADYRLTPYQDGNGNGLRSAEIALGIDIPLGQGERLGDKFPTVVIGLLPGVPEADEEGGSGGDGLRIGSTRIATMSPDGTATAGTIYLHSRRSQYAVRLLGTTGRVRVLEYRPGGHAWIER